MVTIQRGPEIVLAGESSPKLRILSKEAEKDAKEARKCPVRVTQSQEGLTQSSIVPSKQKSEILQGI